MSQQRWEQASEVYRRRQAERSTEQMQAVSDDGVNLTAIAVAARQLEEFLQSSEGIAGLILLKYSQMEIVLHHEYIGMGTGSTYLLDCEGLKESQHPEGMYLAYVKEHQVPRSSVSPVSARVVVDTIARTGKLPESVLELIKLQLDRIAAEILDK